MMGSLLTALPATVSTAGCVRTANGRSCLAALTKVERRRQPVSITEMAQMAKSLMEGVGGSYSPGPFRFSDRAAFLYPCDAPVRTDTRTDEP
jgi:hypothetical protein